MQRRVSVSLATALGLLLAAPRVGATSITEGQPVAPLTPQIRPGEYVWAPEVSPVGPVVIIVSLSEQVLYVYRNGVRIGRTTVSSGKAGHRTPTGVFTILQKNVRHTSSIYKGASMPYMERLTWGGVALHAGNLPGYPAAHGCVRLPLDFAQKLYAVTSRGSTVIITDGNASPGSTAAPGLLFADTPGEAAPPGGVLWKPERAPGGPVSVIVSSADGAVYIYRSGVEIGRAPVGSLPGFKGTYAYSALADTDADGRRNWLSMTVTGGRGQAPNLKEAIKQANVDPRFLAGVRALLTPSTTLVLTDAPVSVSTRRGSGFRILTTGGTL